VISLELTAEQRDAVESTFERCCIVAGAAGTGKTRVLAERAARARSAFPGREALAFSAPSEIERFAFDVLRERGAVLNSIDDVEASVLFTAACAPLLALEWDEFADELDPEVPGLRSPQRFVESSFRLFRKLRDALVTPDEFLSRSLSGAAEFAAKPPNLTDPALLSATKHEYHDSLDVSPQELQRQYRREVDLAKILARLYERYDAMAETAGSLTGRDAVARLVSALRNDPAGAAALRERYPVAFVDAADDATPGHLALLRAIFGSDLAGVTLAYALPASPPANAAVFTLRRQLRSPLAVELACGAVAKAYVRPQAAGVEPAMRVVRVRTQHEEAELVGDRVRAWLDAGSPPERVAVVLRSVRHAEPYEEALLARDIPTIARGDVNVFADRRALDAMALLWNAYDPFRHDWLLRTLANPAFALSDASLSTLCAEPPHPQTPLFLLDDEPAPTVRSSRWDPKRDLRLGWNVVRGEQDEALTAEARTSLERFRRLRAGWVDAMYAMPFEAFVRTVWGEGLAREGAPGSARALAQQAVLRRLLARLLDFRRRGPERTFADVLEYAGRRAASEFESCEDDAGGGFVQIVSVEAARGLEFDEVAVAGVRPGLFPRWYVPDTFLYSPRAGMIPKENVGDARASRTAKFTYYMHRNKTRERYNERERQLFLDALRRARRAVLVSAWGPPTRGLTAPEFLEELRVAKPPGTVVE